MQVEVMPPAGFSGRYLRRTIIEEVNLSMIHLWCEMLEDANPLYHDETYAKSSQRRDRRPADDVSGLERQSDLDARGRHTEDSHRALIDVPGYPNATLLSIVQHYHCPLRLESGRCSIISPGNLA